MFLTEPCNKQTIMRKMFASVVWYYNPEAFASSNRLHLYKYLHPTSNHMRVLSALLTLELQARDMDKVIHPSVHKKVAQTGGPRAIIENLKNLYSCLHNKPLPNFYEHLQRFVQDQSKWEQLVVNLKNKNIGCLMRIVE